MPHVLPSPACGWLKLGEIRISENIFGASRCRLGWEVEGKKVAEREEKKLFTVTPALQEFHSLGTLRQGLSRPFLLSCLTDSCHPNPMGWCFCLSGHRRYFKRKQLACFPAKVGLAKLSPSNHSLGIYFCPPDFPRHFLGLFVWFLLGVMEHDKNREKSQARVHSFEKFMVKANTRLRTPRQHLIARAGYLVRLGAVHGAWVIECSSLGWLPASSWAWLRNMDLLKYLRNCVSSFSAGFRG